MYLKQLAYVIIIIKIIFIEFSATSVQRWKIPKNRIRTVLPDGYVPHPQFHAAYKIYELDFTWNQAYAFCKSDGAYLAVTDTLDKVTAIDDMKLIDDKWIHVGICRPENSNDWIRVDTGETLSDLPWAAGQPDVDGHCVGIDGDEDRDGFDEGLIDYGCDEPAAHFVCEIPI